MYKKIDIYLKNSHGAWTYETSTNASKTFKQAKQNFCIRHCLSKDQVKAIFSK